MLAALAMVGEQQLNGMRVSSRMSGEVNASNATFTVGVRVLVTVVSFPLVFTARDENRRDRATL